MLRGQGKRTPINHFADSREQVLSCLRHAATHHDHGRVEQAHTRGQNPPEIAARLAHRTGRPDIASPDKSYNISARPGGQTSLGEFCSDCATAGECLQASDVAAAANQVLPPGDSDVTQVAGGSLSAATDGAVDDQASANPRRNLDKQQVFDVWESQRVFTARHKVDVIVDKYRGSAEHRAELADHICPIPPGPDRRIHRPACTAVDRTRKSDADPDKLAHRAPTSRDQLARDRTGPG